MNSPIGWIGGKRALRKEIIALFPQDGVGRYIEVFFGAGWVFFGRPQILKSLRAGLYCRTSTILAFGSYIVTGVI